MSQPLFTKPKLFLMFVILFEHLKALQVLGADLTEGSGLGACGCRLCSASSTLVFTILNAFEMAAMRL